MAEPLSEILKGLMAYEVKKHAGCSTATAVAAVEAEWGACVVEKATAKTIVEIVEASVRRVERGARGLT